VFVAVPGTKADGFRLQPRVPMAGRRARIVGGGGRAACVGRKAPVRQSEECPAGRSRIGPVGELPRQPAVIAACHRHQGKTLLRRLPGDLGIAGYEAASVWQPSASVTKQREVTARSRLTIRSICTHVSNSPWRVVTLGPVKRVARLDSNVSMACALRRRFHQSDCRDQLTNHPSVRSLSRGQRGCSNHW